jgi:hypothetical protein
MGVGGQHHALAALPTGKRLGTHSIGGWVGPRAGLDGYRKSLPIGIQSPDRPAHSQSLYKLKRSLNTDVLHSVEEVICKTLITLLHTFSIDHIVIALDNLHRHG